MENKNNNVLLTVIAVATLLVAIVGASFAYFSASGGTDSETVKTGALKISAVATAVSEANIKPVDTTDMSVEDKMGNADIAKLPVTINTTGTTISGQYNMYLTTENIQLNTAGGEGGQISDIKWELVKNGNVIYSGEFKDNGSGNGDVTKMPLNATGQGTESVSISPIAIPSSTVEGVTTYGAEEAYTLLIYIENTEDSVAGNGDGVQDQLQGLEITAYITVEAIQTPNE